MLDSLKEYIGDRITLAKLEGVEVAGKIAGNAVYVLLMLIFAFFFIMLLSFAGGYYLADLYGKTYGFLIVTGIYLLLIILFLIFKKAFVKAVVNIVIAASIGDIND